MKTMPAIALISLVGLLLPVVSGYFAGSEGFLIWLIDLAAHWQWLFLMGLVIAGVFSTYRNWRWGALLLAVPAPYLTASEQAPEVEPEDSIFTVASANVSLSNRDPRPLVEWLSDERMDVVALFEVSPDYSAHLGVVPGFAFQKVVPSHGPFGIGLLSRHPMMDVKVVHDADGIAHIEAEIDWQGHLLKVIAFHPMPPLEPRYQVERDSKLRSLAKAAIDEGHPAILAGDINATPWSSAFSGLADHGLRRATGLAPSWPTELQGFMGIPIDHVLVTPRWAVVQSEIGPELGSDHFPVIARLVLRSRTASYPDSNY